MSHLDNLVQRCQQGELAAFSELFEQQETAVYRLALTILQNEQDAEDAVQDVFLRIFEQIKNYRGQSSFRTWLTAIVVNSCRDKLRRRKVRRAFALDWLRGHAMRVGLAGEGTPDEAFDRLPSLSLRRWNRKPLPAPIPWAMSA